MDSPAVRPAGVGPIAAILLTHDHHGDNLDAAGRALLPSAGVVVTTVSGAKRLGGSSRRPEAGPGPVAGHATGAAGPASDRDHRHAVPSRTRARALPDRRRHRLRAALERP